MFYGGEFVQIDTECGIKLRFDGKDKVEIDVPGRYRGNLTGICGNCDGSCNDYRLSNDTQLDVDTIGREEAFRIIGDSYIVHDDSSDAPKT